MPDEIRCPDCGCQVEPEWAAESGGYCGNCLADYAVPLTVISRRDPTTEPPTPV